MEQILCYLQGVHGLGILYSDHTHTHIECLQMLIGLVQELIEDLLLAIAFLLVEIWYLGRVRNKLLYLDFMKESEYRFMAQSTYEILWIHRLVRDLV